MRDYTELPELGELILEESFVLDVKATPGALVFSVEFALTDKHPEYVPPEPGTYLCYRRGSLAFGGVRKLEWEMLRTRPTVDPDGSADYGDLDFMHFLDDHFKLGGDVGQFEIHADRVDVTLLPADAEDA